MQCTNGYGVDIIVNSLSGEALQKSLELLAPFGRFIELGKRDIWGDSKLSMKNLRKNISFIVVDLMEYMSTERGIDKRMTECAKLIQNGELTPVPTHVFELAD